MRDKKDNKRPNLSNFDFNIDELDSLVEIEQSAIKKAKEDSIRIAEALAKEKADIKTATKDATLQAVFGDDMIIEDYETVKDAIYALNEFSSISGIPELVKKAEILKHQIGGDKTQYNFGEDISDPNLFLGNNWFTKLIGDTNPSDGLKISNIQLLPPSSGADAKKPDMFNEWDDEIMSSNWYAYRKMMNIGGDYFPPMNALGFLTDDSPQKRASIQKIGGEKALKAYVNMVDRLPVLYAEREALKEELRAVNSKLYRKNSDAGPYSPTYTHTKEYDEYLALESEVSNNVDLFAKLYSSFKGSPSFYDNDYNSKKEDWIESLILELENEEATANLNSLGDEFKTGNALKLLQNQPTR